MQLNDTSNTVHLLHALGNTGSKNITNLLFDNFSHSSSVEVKLAALGATRKLTAYKPVQDAFIAVLESNPDECIVEEIVKTLLIGEEHSQNLREYLKENIKLLKALVASSMCFKNNTNLHLLIQQYLKMVDTAESHRLVEFLEQQTGSKRVRRQGTSDWDASNSLLGSTVVSPYVGMARKQNGGYNASISVQTPLVHLVANCTHQKTVRSAL